MASKKRKSTVCKHGHDKTIVGTDSQNRCRECQRIRHRYKRKKRKYGIDKDAYHLMIKNQNGKCAICRRSPKPDKFNRTFTIDHCHKTGVIRGLLCNPCNLMLGWARDSRKTLLAAVEYLDH